MLATWRCYVLHWWVGKWCSASATPSLESWANVESGKYRKIDLKSRFGVAKMPEMRAIDMRKETLPGDRWISLNLHKMVCGPHQSR